MAISGFIGAGVQDALSQQVAEQLRQAMFEEEQRQAKAREGIALGEVTGLIETGPQCVLRVRPADGADLEDRLIPFVQAYVDQVDLAARRIVVDWGVDY